MFKIGDQVIKGDGDYSYIGEVRSVIIKKSGAIRYVVEDSRGLLLIFNEKSLRIYTSTSGTV